jgi:hypothetical protein
MLDEKTPVKLSKKSKSEKKVKKAKITHHQFLVCSKSISKQSPKYKSFPVVNFLDPRFWQIVRWYRVHNFEM